MAVICTLTGTDGSVRELDQFNLLMFGRYAETLENCLIRLGELHTLQSQQLELGPPGLPAIQKLRKKWRDPHQQWYEKNVNVNNRGKSKLNHPLFPREVCTRIMVF